MPIVIKYVFVNATFSEHCEWGNCFHRESTWWCVECIVYWIWNEKLISCHLSGNILLAISDLPRRKSIKIQKQYWKCNYFARLQNETK